MIALISLIIRALSGSRAKTMYPASHELATQPVRTTFDAIAREPGITADDLITRLVEQGIPKVDAAMLAALVPAGFAIPVLRATGVRKFWIALCVWDTRNQQVGLPIAN